MGLCEMAAPITCDNRNGLRIVQNKVIEVGEIVLPAQAVQSNRARGGLYIGRMREDGTCEPMVYHITITAPGAADWAPVEAFLKTDPLFARMESQQSQAWPDGRVNRIFKMVVVP